MEFTGNNKVIRFRPPALRVSGVLIALTATAIGLYLCYDCYDWLTNPDFNPVAACRSPDGLFECVILEKPPPGLLMQSPYTQRVEIRDRTGRPLPGKTPKSSTDSCILSDPKVTWNGEGFAATSTNRAFGRGFVYDGRQIWPDDVQNDADLASLAGFIPLREVCAYSSDVTDAGLMHLATCPNLTRLQLQNTQVTDAGARRLQVALPNLKIENISATSRPGGDGG